MRLDLAEYPSEEVLAQLNQACLDAGIPRWPGYDYVVYADIANPSVYLAWQKGIAWLPIIIGILATVALPPLLMSLVWWILPEEIKSLISGLVNMGMMLLVVFLVTKMVPALSPGRKKPKQIEEAPR